MTTTTSSSTTRTSNVELLASLQYSLSYRLRRDKASERWARKFAATSDLARKKKSNLDYYWANLIAWLLVDRLNGIARNVITNDRYAQSGSQQLEHHELAVKVRSIARYIAALHQNCNFVSTTQWRDALAAAEAIKDCAKQWRDRRHSECFYSCPNYLQQSIASAAAETTCSAAEVIWLAAQFPLEASPMSLRQMLNGVADVAAHAGLYSAWFRPMARCKAWRRTNYVAQTGKALRLLQVCASR